MPNTAATPPFSSMPGGQTDSFLLALAQQPAVLVRVVETQGSVPREAGAWMAVFAATTLGTIGGGHLEYDAIALARQRLDGAPVDEAPHRFALGPSLGQCCGGVVFLSFERVAAHDLPRLRQQFLQDDSVRLWPLALFGGGHVGHALAGILATLPFALTWIDSRDGVFPPHVPPRVMCEHSEPVQAAVAELAPQSRVLIMSFSHAEDLDIVAACLQRQRSKGDLPYIGLIGSQTKWAAFRHRLAARGFTDEELAHVTSPIGLDGITGKEPEVIAVAVAAQLLQSAYAT